MKKKAGVVFILTTLFITGCGTTSPLQEDVAKVKEKDKVQVETASASPENAKPVEKQKEEFVSDAIVNIDQVKKVKIGMSKDEVIELVGLDFKKTSIMYDGEAGWSLEEPMPKFIMDYSDGALVEGYVFESEFEDEVGIEGIYSQKRGSMVVIRLSDEGFVEQVMAIYYNQDDKHVYEYYLFEDGFVKDHAIYPYPEQ